MVQKIKSDVCEQIFRVQMVKETKTVGSMIPRAPALQFNRGEMAKPQTVHRDQRKVGRNDPCACGSGKKYKKCCGR
jgi:preprotein translocase subunit SecA